MQQIVNIKSLFLFIEFYIMIVTNFYYIFHSQKSIVNSQILTILVKPVC